MNLIKRWKKFYYNLQIKDKMLVSFLPLIITPILIIGFNSYLIFQNNAIKKTIQDSLNNSFLINQRIDNIITNTESCANMITFDLNDIANTIKESNTSRISEVERRYSIENKLNFNLLVFKDVEKAIFIDKYQKIYTSNGKILSDDECNKIQSYIQQLEDTSGYSIWFNMTKIRLDNNKNYDIILPLGKKIIEIGTGETIGYLILLVNEKNFSTMFQQMQELKTSNFFLIDSNNTIISSTQTDKILKAVENPILEQWIDRRIAEGDVKLIKNTKMVYTKTPLNDDNWLIVYQVHLDELMQDYRLLNNILIIVMFLCLVITAFVAIDLSKLIVKPIQKLIRTMQSIERNNYNEQLYVRSRDEVGQLTYTYNKMIEKIKDLIKRVKEEQRAKRKYELALLQEQIKPHFLYNTLNMIYTLSDLGQIKAVKKSVKALADFYRLSLSSGKEIITIKEEIDIIKNYLYIQQLRYKDVFKYEINISKEILDYSILKLSIQPLVENAIYHGLKNKTTFGTLRIRGYLKNNIIWVEVMDDGVGMSEELIEKVWEKDSSSKFGLSSIDHRIKLFFGEKYGIFIESKPKKGTIVKIKIPIQKVGDNNY